MRAVAPPPVDLAEQPVFVALAEARRTQNPLVVGQLGQSLDGRIATQSGHSHYINGPGALAVLHALRAAVDAVVVGAGTAIADDPRLTVRLCPGQNPARVLVDRTRRAGSALKMLSPEDGVRRLVIGPPRDGDPPGVEAVSLPGDPIAPVDIVAALATRGLRTVLVEGGAHTVSAFLAAGVLHRLCLLVGPLIVGSGPMGISLPPISRLDDALRPTVTATPLSHGDVLFDCNLRA